MRSVTIPLAAALLLCAGAGIAGAQTQAPSTRQAPPEQATPAPGTNENGSPQQPRSGSSAPPGTLSHDLNRSGGVLQPPPTGDKSVLPPPNQGTSRTPVIPPPGTPGGNEKVQPK